MHSPARCPYCAPFAEEPRPRVWQHLYFIAGFIFGGLAGFGLCFALFASMEGKP